METLKKSDMTAVCDPGLGAIDKCGEYYGPVYTDPGLGLHILVVPHLFI